MRMLAPLGLVLLLLLQVSGSQYRAPQGSQGVTKLRRVTIAELLKHPAYASYLSRKAGYSNTGYNPTSLGLRHAQVTPSSSTNSQRLVSTRGLPYLPGMIKGYGPAPGQPKQAPSSPQQRHSSKKVVYRSQSTQSSNSYQRPPARPSYKIPSSSLIKTTDKNRKLMSNPIIQKYLAALAASVQAKSTGKKPVSLMQPALVKPVYGNSYIPPSSKTSSVHGTFKYATSGHLKSGSTSGSGSGYPPANTQSYAKPQTQSYTRSQTASSSSASNKNYMPVGVVYPSYNGAKPTYRLIPLFGKNPYNMFGSQTYGPLPLPAGYSDNNQQQTSVSINNKPVLTNYGMLSRQQSSSSSSGGSSGYPSATPPPYVPSYQQAPSSSSQQSYSSNSYSSNTGGYSSGTNNNNNNNNNNFGYSSNNGYSSSSNSDNQQSYKGRPSDSSNMRSFSYESSSYGGAGSNSGGGNIPVITISLEAIEDSFGGGDGYSSPSSSSQGGYSSSGSSSFGDGFSYASSSGAGYGSDPYSDTPDCVDPPSDFCSYRQAGHYSHPFQDSCFVQCDAFGKGFAQACAPGTRWLQRGPEPAMYNMCV